MANNTFVVGVTGGIGSGKSEVCRRFIAKGITVVDADVVARMVVAQGTAALEEIRTHFGEGILLPATENQQAMLNRTKLRDIIFSNPKEKAWLEQLLHPLINQQIRTQLKAASEPYVILASPLLLETQQHLLTNRVLVIDTSEQLQIERASYRDASNEAQIKAIMETQLSRQDRCARANDIIQNHGTLDELDEQVDKLHQLYLELARRT